MDSSVRLRFAPSPTGPLHIGGIRTALYNYLFARKYGGSFILRIEDTDQGRYVQGAEQYIIDCLNWVGLVPDEGPGFGGPYGPYRQSDRKPIYVEHALALINKGEAYYAFDTGEELENLRAANGGNQKYDFVTRNQMRNSLVLSEDETNRLLKAGLSYVIRLKVPENQEVQIEDIIRGQVIFKTTELDDKVLIKSDGMPTYHMANVVDDYLMKISHVIRGEEWLSSTAHHVLLYRAFGWLDQMPKFAHLPLIMKPTGNGKLSKRDGAQFGFPVFPISWQPKEGESLIGFREFGFEPEALLNFLALLGWNNGTEQEIYSMEELIQAFSLEKIVKSGARFDFEKGKWFNQQYLHQKSGFPFIQRIKDDFINNGIQISDEIAEQIFDLFKDRVLFFKDYLQLGKVYFLELESYDSEFIIKKFKPEFISVLQSVSEILNHLEFWNPEQIEVALKEFLKSAAIKPGELFPLLRVLISGIPTGPDAFKMISFLGREKMVIRIYKFIEFINTKKQEA
ncbi:MAG: glutamate--tRNA ligase [Saprospiraceae bacterium]